MARLDQPYSLLSLVARASSLMPLFYLDFNSFCLTRPRCELHSSFCPVPLLLDTVHHALPELGRPLVLGQV